MNQKYAISRRFVPNGYGYDLKAPKSLRDCTLWELSRVIAGHDARLGSRLRD